MTSFAEVLHSPGPAPDHARALMLYGRFVGAWEGTVRYRARDGAWREASAEVHFGWVLQGRAIQDVWIAPARGERDHAPPEAIYGTTLRVYDPTTDRWQITWIDPSTNAFTRMEARGVGDDIVQEHDRRQWLFTEITDDSFHWISRERGDAGEWTIDAEYFLRRRA